MDHFITIAETSDEDLNQIFDSAVKLRDQRNGGRQNPQILAGKTLSMIFEKPSLRTRASFEQAIVELGGHAIMFSDTEVGLGKREAPVDVASVLSGMVHGIIARVFEHQKLIDMASAGYVPVINALSDYSHPAQALADALTLMDEFGRDLSERTLAYVGDGNNVARSLATLCSRLGVHFVCASPPGYELTDEFIGTLPKMSLRTCSSAAEAVKEADAIYTDTWTSMGQETENAKRREAFANYQINDELLTHAPGHAIVLHCLPAYRNIEITDEVLDGPSSRVFAQSHNRLHAQKGLLAVLFYDRREVKCHE